MQPIRSGQLRQWTMSDDIAPIKRGAFIFVVGPVRTNAREPLWTPWHVLFQGEVDWFYENDILWNTYLVNDTNEIR